MNNGFYLGIDAKNLRKRIFIAVAFSLLVLQLVFSCQVNASPANTTNDGSQGVAHTEALSTPIVSVTGVTLNKSSIRLKIKATETLKAKLIPSKATNKSVYWESSDTDIATVDLLKGKVVALKAGTATITVTTEDGNIPEYCEVTVIPDPDILIFEDINLEEAVRDSISKYQGDLYKDDVKNIINLDVRDKSINDLSGIEKLTNLQQLNLSSDLNQSTPNHISDISYLKKLTKLKSLSLSNNEISDLDPIKGLTNLTSLDLSGNQMSDISLLVRFTKLTNLNLSNNQISDIIPIKELKKLKILHLEQNEISNINPLKALKKLKYLYLSENEISERDKESLDKILYSCKIYF